MCGGPAPALVRPDDAVGKLVRTASPVAVSSLTVVETLSVPAKTAILEPFQQTEEPVAPAQGRQQCRPAIPAAAARVGGLRRAPSVLQ